MNLKVLSGPGHRDHLEQLLSGAQITGQESGPTPSSFRRNMCGQHLKGGEGVYYPLNRAG